MVFIYDFQCRIFKLKRFARASRKQKICFVVKCLFMELTEAILRICSNISEIVDTCTNLSTTSLNLVKLSLQPVLCNLVKLNSGISTILLPEGSLLIFTK